MPGYLPVPTLYNLALKVIEDDFIVFVRDEMCLQADDNQLFCSYSPDVFSDCVAILQNLVSLNLPFVVRRDLLESVLKKADLSCAIRYAAIEILYSGEIYNFVPGTFPQSFHPLILSRIITDCMFMKSLDLTYFWVRGTDKRYLSKLFLIATNLTSIVMPQICDDSLLAVIGQNCPNISLLDAQDSTAVTEDGIHRLIFSDTSCPTPQINRICSSLVVFKIGGPQSTSIAPSCVSLLLRYAPYITNLGPYTYCGRLLQTMLENQLDSKPTCLFYIHDVYTNSVQMDAVLKLAPRLKGAYFDTPQDVCVPLISKLKLKKLKIRKVWWTDLFSAINMMDSLQVLELNGIRGHIDLSQLSRIRSLQKLSVYQCHDLTSVTFNYYFEQLNFFEVYHTEVSDQIILHLLTHCPAAKHLGFGNFGGVGDEELIPILSAEKLAHLEELWIARAEFLTEHSLAAILDFCPKIKSIGKFEGWDTTKEKIDMFQAMAVRNNWDLKLWEFFRDF